MTFDYASIANTALKQIEDKGRSVDLIYKEQGEYDPANDAFNNAHNNSIQITAVITNFKTSQIDGTITKRGDKMALVAAEDIENAPSTSDLIIDGDDQYTIVDVEEIAPGDKVLVYKIQMRR